MKVAIPTSLAIIGLLCPASMGASGLALAQSTSANAAPVCLARTADNGATVNIIAPATDIEGLIKKGFQVTSCNDAFATAEQREDWKNAICTIVATSNEGVQDALERKLGERPNVLCGMAEIAVSNWRRGGKNAR